MKISILISRCLIVFLICMSYAVFAQTTYIKNRQIILRDRNSGYPVLKIIKDAGFLGYHNIVYFGPGEKSIVENTEDILVTSDLVNNKDEVMSSFTISSKLTSDAFVNINWQLPRDDDYDEMRGDTLHKYLDLVMLSDKSDELFLHNLVLDRNTKSFSIQYAEDKNGSYIEGYDFVIEKDASKPRFWRTFIEVNLISGVGLAKYWMDKNDNKEDWRYETNWSGLKEKIGDGWQYDTNSFRTNTVYHMYAGAIYYQAARSNGYGVLGSIAWTFAGSLIWEYVAEYKEYTSLNDMIFTTSGALLGEGFRQSSIFIEDRFGSNIFTNTIAFLLDPMRIINRSLDRYYNSSYRVQIVFINPAVNLLDKAAKK